MNRRHVAFQIPQSTSREKEEQSGHSRGSRISSDYEVTALDHLIGDHGGTTSTLECLPHRLRLTKEKEPETLKEHIEKLTRENGYLRQELAYYKETREILMRLYGSINESHRLMEDALCEASKGFATSEQRLLEYWGIHHDDGSSVDNVF
jgi:predicted acylesterase/phospholipase RssA